MGSLYNMLFGKSPFADQIESILGMDVGRLRDAGIERDEDGKYRIWVYTRNGGGNREHSDYLESDSGLECSCTGCIQTYRIPGHPWYLYDRDDEFDCTYCTNYFSIPEELQEELGDLLDDTNVERFNPDENWEKMLNAIKEMSWASQQNRQSEKSES